MKELLSSGNVLISGVTKFGLHRMFDPWPSHSNGLLEVGTAHGYGGGYTCFIKWRLLSGLDYYYLFAANPTKALCQTVITNWLWFKVPGVYLPAVGEGYNLSIRAQCILKLSQSEFDAYGVVVF
jgi:hypothetical protein